MLCLVLALSLVQTLNADQSDVLRPCSTTHDCLDDFLNDFYKHSFVVVNALESNWSSHVSDLLGNPRLPVACPSCKPLPRSLLEACQIVGLGANVLPWYLSLVQMPTRMFGNYMMHVFLAWLLARAHGMPFVVVTSISESKAFKYYGEWETMWALFKRLPWRATRMFQDRDRTRKLLCDDLALMKYPHESHLTKPLWESHALRFGRMLESALDTTIVQGWYGIGTVWPGSHDFVSPSARKVAIHLRCGDALAERDWGLLPWSAYRHVLREGDSVVLVAAAPRGSDKPFAEVCKRLDVSFGAVLRAELGVVAIPFFDDFWNTDLSRLAFADVVVCGPSSTFCFWAALVAAARGKTAHIQGGKLLMNASRPSIPGITWSRVSRHLAFGNDFHDLITYMASH
eukprot:TRINITY_DN57248_c0_g1_i1.p1 TRINITY_DN57248_c0_g1~~TRINITY_DN57248_c0_g1_i1.p1  ORF type:complete len:399 (+),score=15.33 TRINITY_DN57248_c0_g1_i1:208-1404(+)